MFADMRGSSRKDGDLLLEFDTDSDLTPASNFLHEISDEKLKQNIFASAVCDITTPE